MSIVGDLLGGFLGGAFGVGAELLGMDQREDEFDAALAQQNKQIALQREFAQQGIRWRVEDAKAAGVHPLYALGAGGASFSPVSIVGDSGIADHWSRIGQDLSRAVAAQETPEQKLSRYLDLEIKRAQLKKIHSDIISDQRISSSQARASDAVVAASGFPSPHEDVFAGGLMYKPREITSRDWSNLSYSAGSAPMWDRRQTSPRGSGAMLSSVPSDVSETFENPVSGLWALNETLAEDPEFFKYSSFPWGKDFYAMSEALWDLRNSIRERFSFAPRSVQEWSDRRKKARIPSGRSSGR